MEIQTVYLRVLMVYYHLIIQDQEEPSKIAKTIVQRMVVVWRSVITQALLDVHYGP
eukprot:UN06293